LLLSEHKGLLINLVESLKLLRLACESLDGPNIGEVLLGDLGQSRLLLLHLLLVLANHGGEHSSKDEDGEDAEQGDAGQLPRNEEHDCEGDNYEDGAPQDHGDVGGESVLDHGGVARHPTQDLPGLVGVKELDVLVGAEKEEVVPDLPRDALTDGVEGLASDPGAHSRNEYNDEHA